MQALVSETVRAFFVFKAYRNHKEDSMQVIRTIEPADCFLEEVRRVLLLHGEAKAVMHLAKLIDAGRKIDVAKICAALHLPALRKAA